MPDDTTLLSSDREEGAEGINAFPAGQSFGKYQILGEVGRGGMGIVYKVRDPDLDRVVALKVLRGGDSALESQLKMFQREIESLARVQHPNIITIHEVGSAEGRRYYTMDLVDGCTLQDILSRHREAGSDAHDVSMKEVIEYIRKTHGGDNTGKPAGPVRMGRTRALDVSRALNIMLKVLRALEHIHDRGIIHRDIKPANIMITRDGEPLLMDFGLARQVDTRESLMITQDGQVVGTPAYMSPEQAAGERGRVNEKSDIYAMGALLYEMLTGRPPVVPTGNIILDLRAVAEKEPRPVRALNPDAPVDAATLCHKALEKDPERRYQTAGAFADDIRRFLAGDPVLARPQSLPYRLRKKLAKHRAVSLAASAVLVVIVAALGYRHRTKWEMWRMDRALALEKAKSEARWIPAYQNEFNGEGLDSINWHYTRPGISTLSYGVRDGALRLENRGRLMSRVPVAGNVRVTFDACAEGQNEISVYLNSDSTYGDDGLYYRFFWNEDMMKWRKEGLMSASREIREGYNDGYFKRETLTVDLDKNPGKWFHVEVWTEDGRCVAVIGRRDTLVCEDVFTLSSNPGNNRWGFRSLVGRVSVDNLKVFRQTLPERIDITRVADILASRGAFSEALAHLKNVIVSYPDAALVGKSLGKIMALTEMSGDPSPFRSIMADKGVLERTLKAAEPAVLFQFLAASVKAMRSDTGSSPVLDYALRQFASGLDTEARFRFFIYLGLAFPGEYGRRYWKEALVLRPDTVVARYLAEGPVPRTIRRQGAMRCIPGGWMPYKFGDVRFIGGFWMDTTEVTQAAYLAVMDTNPAYFNGERGGIDYGSDLSRPVERIGFYQALQFCNARSRKEGLAPAYRIWNIRDSSAEKKVTDMVIKEGHMVEQLRVSRVTKRIADFALEEGAAGYRLPLPWEFEYAQRGGAATDFHWGDDLKAAGRFEWFLDNADLRAHPVAGKLPNRFGLYDMSGNLGEWVYESAGAGVMKVSGGWWRTRINYLFSGRCIATDIWDAEYEVGFRCVRDGG